MALTPPGALNPTWHLAGPLDAELFGEFFHVPILGSSELTFSEGTKCHGEP